MILLWPAIFEAGRNLATEHPLVGLLVVALGLSVLALIIRLAFGR